MESFAFVLQAKLSAGLCLISIFQGLLWFGELSFPRFKAKYCKFLSKCRFRINKYQYLDIQTRIEHSYAIYNTKAQHIMGLLSELHIEISPAIWYIECIDTSFNWWLEIERSGILKSAIILVLFILRWMSSYLAHNRLDTLVPTYVPITFNSSPLVPHIYVRELGQHWFR